MMMRAHTFLQQKSQHSLSTDPNTRCFLDVPLCSVYGILTYILVYKSMVHVGEISHVWSIWRLQASLRRSEVLVGNYMTIMTGKAHLFSSFSKAGIPNNTKLGTHRATNSEEARYL